MIPVKDFNTQMRRLAAHLQANKFEGDVGAALLVDYYNLIGRVRMIEDLKSAVTQILENPKTEFFPKAGKIIEAMRSVALGNVAKENVRLLSQPVNSEGQKQIAQVVGKLKGKKI